MQPPQVLLLSIRMAAESLFRRAFPLWWTTTDAAQTLAQVDHMISQMFDPSDYHSHIPPLESSSEAIRLAARDELGIKCASRLARHFHDLHATAT